MDFTTSKRIGNDIAKVPGGADHNWVLNKGARPELDHCFCTIRASGRACIVFTTEPGVQIYSGNFLDGTLKTPKAARTYGSMPVFAWKHNISLIHRISLSLKHDPEAGRDVYTNNDL